ncbi:MAG TPA: extracellular solute-binding protein, partial [Anaerolineae bacterium]|nr:extracellular solute-binding protein [Anaerolineae bacterium]
DGDLFFSVQADNPAWVSAQLQPGNQTMYRADGQISKAEAHGEEVWANVTWEEDGERLQRIAFFRWQNGRLLHVPASNSYWGPTLREDTDWGQLSYAEIDQAWVEEIDRFTADTIAELCASGCLPDKLPLTLVLTPDYSQTAVPDRLNIPSPRLVALDKNGRPANIFWEQLRGRLEAFLTPAVIRFAVPPPRVRDGQALFNYERAAAAFMAARPEITVEIVALETLPKDPAVLALEFDGAAYPPTKAMLTAGLAADLTDFAYSDPDFDRADFYEQIWRGAEWRDRLWMMPLAAQMPVLYYDETAYEQAGMPEPSLRWTWAEMERDIATIVAAQPENSRLTWGFLDTGLDALFSYAWNWENDCRETASVLCQRPLPPQNVTAALDWYGQRVNQPGQMPDLSANIEELLGASAFLASSNWIGGERQFVLWNFQTSRRKAAVWVDLPVNYEHQLLLAPLGVAPFPGSDRFDGITPLWVQGAFISRQSERPYAVWQWLKFLSYQAPTPRMVPARPSVAKEIGYWQYLPRPLGNAMRAAFPFARPVTIEDQTRLTWEQVTAVASGKFTPAEAARRQPEAGWFGNNDTAP